MENSELLRASLEWGVDNATRWMAFPEDCASAAVDAAKRVAKLLKSAEGVTLSHTQCLEAVARACSLPNWHAFQTATKRLIEDLSGEEAKMRTPLKERMNRLDEMLPIFPLLARPAVGMPPNRFQIKGITRFAGALAAEAGISLGLALDIQASRFGSATWEDLNARTPVDQAKDARRPLYIFETSQDSQGASKGRFKCSERCLSLMKWPGRLVPDYADFPRENQLAARERVESVLARRDDFLEGWLSLGFIREMEGESHQSICDAYMQGIRRAEALIPRQFHGRIGWGEEGNGFYLQLLHNLMVQEVISGDLKAALDLCEKQLRINPSDDLSAKVWLPIILLASGSLDAAAMAASLLARDSIYRHTLFEMQLIQSAVEWLRGHVQDSARLALVALFLFPSFRRLLAVVLGAEATFTHSDDSLRAITPDIEQAANMLDALCARLPDFVGFLAKCFVGQDVAEAELFLQSKFMDAWNNKSEDGVQAWKERCFEMARALSLG